VNSNTTQTTTEDTMTNITNTVGPLAAARLLTAEGAAEADALDEDQAGAERAEDDAITASIDAWQDEF
jgi:hypothetical protein